MTNPRPFISQNPPSSSKARISRPSDRQNGSSINLAALASTFRSRAGARAKYPGLPSIEHHTAIPSLPFGVSTRCISRTALARRVSGRRYNQLGLRKQRLRLKTSGMTSQGFLTFRASLRADNEETLHSATNQVSFALQARLACLRRQAPGSKQRRNDIILSRIPSSKLESI